MFDISVSYINNIAPRLSGQFSIFGVVFFVSKSLLGIERRKKFKKITNLTRKPRSHVRILIYRTWLIITHVHSHWSVHETFCLVAFPLPSSCRRGS